MKRVIHFCGTERGARALGQCTPARVMSAARAGRAKPWLLAATLFFVLVRLLSTARNTPTTVPGRLRSTGFEQVWQSVADPGDDVEPPPAAASRVSAAASLTATAPSGSRTSQTRAASASSTAPSSSALLSRASSVLPAQRAASPLAAAGQRAATPNPSTTREAARPAAAAAPIVAAPGAATSAVLCTLSTPGQWALTTGSHAPYDMRWRPTSPCNYSVASPRRLVAAFAGMTLTFVGDSVTRNAVRALGKAVAGMDEQGFDEFEWHANGSSSSSSRRDSDPAGDDAGRGVLVRFRHSGSAQGVGEWATDAPKRARFHTFDAPAGGVRNAVWVINAGLWNSAWPNGVMNQNWSVHGDVTLPLILRRYEEQLVAARDALLAALPALRDTCEGRARAVFRLTTPVLNKVPARDGWLAWATAHFVDVDAVVDSLNAVARRVWSAAGLPVIELGQLSSAPPDVRPRLTLDHVHVPEGISMDVMWWLLSALHDAGLSTQAAAAGHPVGGRSGQSDATVPAEGWPVVCAAPADAQHVAVGSAPTSSPRSTAAHAAAPATTVTSPLDGGDAVNAALKAADEPAFDLDVLAAELPGVPLVLRRIAAAGPLLPAPTLPPLPPAHAASERSVLACSGGALPHARRCRMASVCLERPATRVVPSEFKPRWVFFGGRVNASEFQLLPGYAPGVPCLPATADAAGVATSVVCNGQPLLWAGSVTENFMRLAPTIVTAAPPVQGASFPPLPGAVEWHAGRVVALSRHDTTNMAHTNSDDLFPLLGLLEEAGGEWAAKWLRGVGAAALRGVDPSQLQPGLESWPADREQPLVLFTDAGIGWLNGAYTAAVLHGLQRVHGPFALVAGAEPRGGQPPRANATNSSIALVCFRDVSMGVGGRGLFRGAGFGWDFAWTWNNAADHWDRARYLAASRRWFDHLRTVFGLPPLVEASRALAALRAARGRGDDALAAAAAAVALSSPVAAAELVARFLSLQRTVLIVNRRLERPRHLANAAELAAALAANSEVNRRGLTVRVVDWEDMPAHADVARALASADVVVSVHGAGNAHVGFATPGATTWIEIVPEECAVLESMYEVLARRVGVAWWHLPGARVKSCDRPWSVPGRMCKDPLGHWARGAEFVADVAATTSLVAVVLRSPASGVTQAPPPVVASASSAGGMAAVATPAVATPAVATLAVATPTVASSVALSSAPARRRLGGAEPPAPCGDPSGRIPAGPLAQWVAGQLQQLCDGVWRRRQRPNSSFYTRTHRPRVVVFASFTRAQRALAGVGGLVAALASRLDGERLHKAVPAVTFPGCADVGASPADGKEGCFDPAGLLVRSESAPLGARQRLLLLDDTRAPLAGGGGGNDSAAVLAAWADAVRHAEVVVALHGSPAAALLPLAPEGADWVDLVPPRDAARAVEYAALAARAGVVLHAHSLADPESRCDAPAWERRVLLVHGFALAARVAVLLGETDV